MHNHFEENILIVLIISFAFPTNLSLDCYVVVNILFLACRTENMGDGIYWKVDNMKKCSWVNIHII